MEKSLASHHNWSWPEKLSWGQRKLKRLTGGHPDKNFQMDFGDPTTPVFFKPSELWILTSGETLVWKGSDQTEAWKKFLSGAAPEVEVMNYFRLIDGNTTPFLKDEGDDLWDANIYNFDDSWYLYGGVMTPTHRKQGAIWPDDHFSRRVHAFKLENENWVKIKDDLFALNINDGFLGHGYGHQIVEDDSQNLFMFYEKVTHVEFGLPWVTEIFARRMISPTELDEKEHEILVFSENFPASAKRAFGGALVEGARPFKVNDTWFISFSAGDYDSDDYGVHLAWSKNLTGPYEINLDFEGDFLDYAKDVDKILDGRWGAGRASFFQDPLSRWWVLLHAIPGKEFPKDGIDPKRDIFLAPVEIDTSKKPPEIKILF